MGDIADRYTPTLCVGDLSSISISSLELTYYHSVVLGAVSPPHFVLCTQASGFTAGGKVYTAGQSTVGQLGLGDSSTRVTPTLIANSDISSVTVVSNSANSNENASPFGHTVLLGTFHPGNESVTFLNRLIGNGFRFRRW